MTYKVSTNSTIYYCKCGKNGTNFGDMITPYIYKKVTGKDAVNNKQSDDVVFGAGSIMEGVTANTIVWGTGVMFNNKKFTKPKRILSVRGPITRDVCIKQGYECPEIYGDIGLILPRFYNPYTNIKKYKIGIIPHYVDYEICNTIFSGISDISIIDITNPVEHVIDSVLECDMTISSSLHGIIVSHAYNIKCAWMRVTDKICGGNTKYWDYYQSIGIYNNLPISIQQSSNKSSCIELEQIISNYPNPIFPINTDHIMDVCPF